MFLMAFYVMHKPKNGVEKMKHEKKPNLPKPMDGQFAFQMLYLPKRAFFPSFNSHSDPESCQSHNLK